MDIRQIECFVAVARKGNYTKAAEELFVSRQALSKTVKHLEKEVGEPLFISVPGQSQLKLTQKGTQLMGDAVSLVNAWEAFCKAHAAFDVVCYPQLVGTIQLSGGRRHVKKYIWSF